MSIFRNNTQVGEELTAPLFEGYGVEENGDIIALQESLDDSMYIVQSLHEIEMANLSMRADVKQLRESGAEESAIESRMTDYEAVTESAVGDAWDKIVAFFKKLWGKIVAFFNSVIAHIDAFVRSGESFAKKYESKLSKLNLAGYRVSMYKYTKLDADLESASDLTNDKFDLDEIKSSLTGTSQELQDFVKEIKEEREKILEAVRGELINQGPLQAGEFKSAVFAHFRDGARGKTDKEDIAVNASEMLSVLKNSKKAKEQAAKLKKKIDEEFKSALKKIEDIKKSIKTEGDKENSPTKDTAPHALEAVRAATTIFTAVRDMVMTVFRGWRQAYVERDSTYKHALAGAFSYKPEKK